MGGFFGIGEAQCLGMDCCWDPNVQRPWVHFCYRKRKSLSVERRCPEEHMWEVHQREECPAFSTYLRLHPSLDPSERVRRAKCEHMGCCWDPLKGPTHSPS